jgi:hypothetical protein
MSECLNVAALEVGGKAYLAVLELDVMETDETDDPWGYGADAGWDAGEGDELEREEKLINVCELNGQLRNRLCELIISLWLAGKTAAKGTGHEAAGAPDAVGEASRKRRRRRRRRRRTVSPLWPRDLPAEQRF